jgi:hypothetical protein
LRLAYILWRMSVRSIVTALQDKKVHVLSFLIALLLLGYNGTVVYGLGQLFQTSRISNATLLWLLVGVCWILVGLLSFLTTWQYWLNPDRVLYVLLLPLRPAALFRGLVLTTLASRVGPRILLLMGGLLVTLAWHAPLALLLTLAGLALAISCGMISGWVCFLWITASPRVQWASGICVTIGASVITWLFLRDPSWLVVPWSPVTVLLLTGILLLLSFLFFLVAAAPLGKLYIVAYQKVFSQSRGHTSRHAPGIELFVRFLARYSPVAAALAFKALLIQSRNKLNFLRFSLFAASIVAFLMLIHFLSLLSHYTPFALTVTYGTLVGLYFFLDATPSPLGSEGNRLSHYLIAPFPISRFLWAKLILYLGTVLGVTLSLSAVACLWLHLSMPTTLLALMTIALVNSGLVLIMVWGSIWDEDLHLIIEGGLQAMLYEQLPSTPRRLVLLLASLFFAVGCLWFVWQLSVLFVLPVIALVDVCLGIAFWRFSHYYLAYLIRQG